MSEPIALSGPARVHAQMQTWGLIGIALALYGVLRLLFGPLPQDPSYHMLADTRRCGPIPRAGDVLTNLSILAAGVAGLLLGCLLACLVLRQPATPQATDSEQRSARAAIPGNAGIRLLQRRGHRLLSLQQAT